MSTRPDPVCLPQPSPARAIPAPRGFSPGPAGCHRLFAWRGSGFCWRAALLAGVVLGAGCSIQPVSPWQRGDLAHEDMQWDTGLAGEAKIRDHAYTSKEAASLGASLAGGGCGCN